MSAGGEQDGDTLLLKLNWRAREQLTVPYYFAALPVSPSGIPTETTVWQSNATRYPTTCWRAGDVVGDSMHLPLPPNPEEGMWYISLSAFADVRNPLDTVTTIWEDGTRDRQIGLGGVPVRRN